MSRILTAAICAALLLSTSSGYSQKPGAPKASEMSSVEYQRTIAELSSPNYRTRVAATERLAKRGKHAKSDLARLAKDKNAEVRSRATQLLVRLEPVKKPSSHHIARDGFVILGGGAEVVFGDIGIALPDIEIIEVADSVESVEVIDVLEGVVEAVEAAESVVPPPPIRHVDRADKLPATDIPRFLKELEGTADD